MEPNLKCVVLLSGLVVSGKHMGASLTHSLKTLYIEHIKMKQHNVIFFGRYWKLIHNQTPNTWGLYYLSEDSEEQINLFGKSLTIEDELKGKLNKINQENKEAVVPAPEFTNLKI